MKKVIIITGPTGVGKTKLSIEIAKIFNTSLINGDAYQIYKHLDILTAKPTKDELKEVKHYLMDELDPKISFSIFHYQKLVRDLVDKQDLPIIVGGSGLYIDSVIYDYRFEDEVKEEFDDSLYTNEELHEMLEQLDPENALKIHPNNRKRVIRAIHLAKNQDKSERTLANTHYYEPLIICLSLEREKLYDRINKRVLEMVNDGLIDEVQTEQDLIGPQAAKAIGFSDTLDYINGVITKEEMIDNIQKKSRHYAKRQLTWYNNHQDTKMVNVDLDNFQNTINVVKELIEDFMSKDK